MSHGKPSKVTQPSDRSFDCPSSDISSKVVCVLSCNLSSVPSMRTSQIPSRLLKPFRKRGTIVCSVRVHWGRSHFCLGALSRSNMQQSLVGYQPPPFIWFLCQAWFSRPRILLFSQDRNSHRQRPHPNRSVLADQVCPETRTIIQ